MPIDQSLQSQIQTYLTHLDGLIRSGRDVRENLKTDPANPAAIAKARAWQEECGITINQLSGSSKAHWLARSFSEAFLMRAPDGRALEAAAPAEIISRLLDVLTKAIDTLSGMGNTASAGFSLASSEAPPPHQFDFVHSPELRPVVEQAYIDSKRALEDADYDTAMRTSCGILEAIVTDALEQKGLAALTASGAPAGKIADWSFETRLVVAERAELIRGGCARLPAIARAYRDPVYAGGSTAVSERDARLTGQVLRVIMRDLNPGR